MAKMKSILWRVTTALISLLVVLYLAINIPSLRNAGGYNWYRIVNLNYVPIRINNSKLDAISHMLRSKTLNQSVCDRVISGDNNTLSLCRSDKDPVGYSSADYLNTGCDRLTSEYVVDSSWLPPDELAVPIAFTIMLHKNVYQFERLLRAVYRPHNTYCVHIDAKSARADIDAVRHIATCFNNVHVPQNLVNVAHGGITQLDAELTCMRVLLGADKRWRWFINLTGEEFPLQSLWYVARALDRLNGTNSIHACWKSEFQDRKATMKSVADQFGVVPTVGSTHLIAVRDFIAAAADTNSSVATALHEALKRSPSPDECYFNTLNYSPRLSLAGTPLAPQLATGTRGFINRVKKWDGQNLFPCSSGKYVRQLCIFGLADLPFLTSPGRRELFVNKLYWNFEHWAYDCLETWHWNRTLNEYIEYWTVGTTPTFDSAYYEQYVRQFRQQPVSSNGSVLVS